MTNANTIVELFTLGTLTGDIFVQLQMVFQNCAADLGATPARDLSTRAVQILVDRGFVTADRKGLVPSDKALNALYLQTAMGGRCGEPRDAFDCRLVADVPEWAEQTSAMGVAV